MPICKEELLTEGLEHPLFLRLWLPDGQACGLVQLCHGMATPASPARRWAILPRRTAGRCWCGTR